MLTQILVSISVGLGFDCPTFFQFILGTITVFNFLNKFNRKEAEMDLITAMAATIGYQGTPQ